jgi:hypothetical protein
MNLQENIRRIKSMNMILRRVDPDRLEKEFDESLEYANEYYFRNYDKGVSFESFRSIILNHILDGIHWELYSTTPEDSIWYEDAYYKLKEYFSDKIEKEYYELKGEN